MSIQLPQLLRAPSDLPSPASATYLRSSSFLAIIKSKDDEHEPHTFQLEEQVVDPRKVAES